jgi:hypothetical protein
MIGTHETHQGTAVLENIFSVLSAHLLSALLAPHVWAVVALDHILADVSTPRKTDRWKDRKTERQKDIVGEHIGRI